jgi:hypothetical protein
MGLPGKVAPDPVNMPECKHPIHQSQPSPGVPGGNVHKIRCQIDIGTI